jgi:hypothetical protein
MLLVFLVFKWIPSFQLNEKGYTDRRGTINIGITRFYFLGVLYAGPQHYSRRGKRIIDCSYKSKIHHSIEHTKQSVVIIIKSEKILELENLFIIDYGL